MKNKKIICMHPMCNKDITNEAQYFDHALGLVLCADHNASYE